MGAFEGVGLCCFLAYGEGVVEEAFWVELVGVGETDGVVVDCPPVDHDDGTLWDEVIPVPVVLHYIQFLSSEVWGWGDLCCEMVLAEFVDGTPTENFFNYCADIRKIGFIVEIWRTI